MRKLLALACTAFMATAFTENADATFDFYIDIKAGQASYAPIALGEDLAVDACGSTIHRATHTTPAQNAFSLCELSASAMENFELTWLVTHNNVTTTLQTFTGTNAVNGLQTSFNTGSGTLLSQVGNYLIGIVVHIPEYWSNIVLPNGQVGQAWCDPGVNVGGVHYGPAGTGCSTSGYYTNGFRNTSYAASTVAVTAATVPEPASLGLIGVAIFAIARRRKTKTIASV